MSPRLVAFLSWQIQQGEEDCTSSAIDCELHKATTSTVFNANTNFLPLSIPSG